LIKSRRRITALKAQGHADTASLHQVFATSEIGHFAQQQFSKAHVRLGSKADIARDQPNVRFTPKSGHWNSVVECPLLAQSGHTAQQQENTSTYSLLTQRR
jgi:hypothetical protein